jgi:hypothetical protein
VRKLPSKPSHRGTSPLMRQAVTFILMLALASSIEPSHAQPTGTFDLRIPPQPLDSELKAFAEATNLLLSYEASLTTGRSSPGVSGTYTPEEGLRNLLKGTGLEHRSPMTRPSRWFPAYRAQSFLRWFRGVKDPQPRHDWRVRAKPNPSR